MYRKTLNNDTTITVEVISRTSSFVKTRIRPGSKYEKVKQFKIHDYSGEESIKIEGNIEVYASDKIS